MALRTVAEFDVDLRRVGWWRRVPLPRGVAVRVVARAVEGVWDDEGAAIAVRRYAGGGAAADFDPAQAIDVGGGEVALACDDLAAVEGIELSLEVAQSGEDPVWGRVCVVVEEQAVRVE